MDVNGPQQEAENADNEGPYRLSLGLGVLEHLSDGLYSSLAAVLTEAVANAWDADAVNVEIDVNVDEDRIRIADNGVGMDRGGVNRRFLTVAYRKREAGEMETPSGRRPMGRKGIGKLALLWVSDLVEVETRIEGSEVEAFRIDVAAIRELVRQSGAADYRPHPIEPQEDWSGRPHGTIIRLSRLKNERLRDVGEESLRRRLARRFSVAGTAGFGISVNGTPISPDDRQALRLAQFVWIVEGTPEPLGGWVVDEPARLSLPNRNDGFDGRDWRVTGWIATAPDRKSLSRGLNSIVVLARGRLVCEDILPEVQSGELFTKYLTGQIEADFLDLDDHEDVVTSDRQRLREEDARVQALKALIREHLRMIGPEWLKRRQEGGRERLLADFPRLREWLDGMSADWRELGERFLGRISTLPEEQVGGNEGRVDLLRTGIMGFQRLRLRDARRELERAIEADDAAVMALLRQRDELEASLYRDIVVNRVETTRELEKLADTNALEKVLQRYLFDRLWLLDPAWDRATGNPAIEERMKLTHCFKEDDESKERFGRIDIRYRSAAGKHVIVELKRAGVRPSLGELINQGGQYVDALVALLRDQGDAQPTIEVVFVLGKSLAEPVDRVELALNGLGAGSRVTTYERLAIRARETYNEFLQKTREVDRIERLLERAPAEAEAEAEGADG